MSNLISVIKHVFNLAVTEATTHGDKEAPAEVGQNAFPMFTLTVSLKEDDRRVSYASVAAILVLFPKYFTNSNLLSSWISQYKGELSNITDEEHIDLAKEHGFLPKDYVRPENSTLVPIV